MPGVVTCRTCGAVVLPLESGGACPQCRTPVDGGDETRLAVEPPAPGARPGPGPPSGGVRHSSGSGWLSSSGAIDHGRFQPGTFLGNRYRVIERLGRGGMGEVYRADDLKLGQQVALKFLSADLDADAARLTQLHNEVRMARQVSHPNVCRVYDIDEVDGQTFLSMEYIGGEDLSSLLRRIGRFPQDRGLEIARQICAGLAAAHDRGVVHRDFKPANVMLDAFGHARITDFGLAGASGEAIRAGTPAYMAPEQLSGAEVTARSDIYALGLVLYEIFTGQRALEAKNLAELIRKREQDGIVPPSAIVPSLDPAITGPWTQSARAAPPPASRARAVIAGLAALIMPALMVAAALIARHQVRLGRGDRKGAFRAASVVFVANVVTWLLAASFMGSLGDDVPRLFSAMGMALFRAAVLWLAYLAFEPYVRRFAPDSLIGWSSAIAGHWRDPRVGTDVLIGVSAGLVMTLLYARHNVLPVLTGRPEPMPLTPTVWPLLGSRFVLANIIERLGSGFSEAMLATVGVVALLMAVKRAWLAGLVAAVVFTPAVVDGMFPDGTPILDLAIGFAIISVLIVVILRFGLLASVAALMTHFVLLRAPLTTDLGAWRGTAALWYLGVIAVARLGAIYIARAGRAPRLAPPWRA